MGDRLSIGGEPGPSGISAAAEGQEFLPQGSTAGLGARSRGGAQWAAHLWSLGTCQRRAEQGEETVLRFTGTMKLPRAGRSHDPRGKPGTGWVLRLWVVEQQGQERLPFWRLTHLALVQLQVRVEGQPSPGTGSPATPRPQGILSPIHSSRPQMCLSCKKRQRSGVGDGGWPEKPEPELPEFRPQWERSREGRRCQERAGETV